MQRLIQVFEFEKLTSSSLCSKGEKLGVAIIEKLQKFNDDNHNIFFEAIRHGIKFKQYVGVVQIGSIVIEILPKADRLNTGEKDKDCWRNVLLQMLSKCRKIPLNTLSNASLQKRSNSILDLYFEIFLNEVDYLLKTGLVKKYRKQSGNLNVLKGKLIFSQNIQYNVVRKDRFYTDYEVFDQNNLINQILLEVLLIIKKVSTKGVLVDRLNRLINLFSHIEVSKSSLTSLSRVKLNRKTRKYELSLQIAKMLIENYSPSIKSGRENMIALLFDMNLLWEEYVYRSIAKYQTQFFKVKFQNSDKFWENKRIKPDIVISTLNSSGGYQNYIIDTKWKIINRDQPSDDDLKQMYVYNMYWNAEKGMLLYPSNETLNFNYGNYHKGREGDNKCKLGFVSVLKDGILDPDLGLEIKKLLEL